MTTSLPGVWAAGDCVITHHRQRGPCYLPHDPTAHKQGRVAVRTAPRPVPRSATTRSSCPPALEKLMTDVSEVLFV